jgi:hypothetical protein
MTSVPWPVLTVRSYRSVSWWTRTAVTVSGWSLPLFGVAGQDRVARLELADRDGLAAGEQDQGPGAKRVPADAGGGGGFFPGGGPGLPGRAVGDRPAVPRLARQAVQGRGRAPCERPRRRAGQLAEGAAGQAADRPGQHGLAQARPGELARLGGGDPVGDDELTNTRKDTMAYVTVPPPVLLGARNGLNVLSRPRIKKGNTPKTGHEDCCCQYVPDPSSPANLSEHPSSGSRLSSEKRVLASHIHTLAFRFRLTPDQFDQDLAVSTGCPA